MHRVIGIFALASLLLCSCALFPGDPPLGRELAFSVDSDGGVLVWYKPCRQPNPVKEILVEEWRSNSVRSGPEVWRVKGSNFVEVGIFEIGVSIPGLDTVTRLKDDFVPEKFAITFERQRDFPPGEVVTLSKLREGVWLNLGKYRTTEEMTSRNTCNY